MEGRVTRCRGRIGSEARPVSVWENEESAQMLSIKLTFDSRCLIRDVKFLRIQSVCLCIQECCLVVWYRGVLALSTMQAVQLSKQYSRNEGISMEFRDEEEVLM